MPFIAEFSQGSAPGNARKPLPAEEAFPGWAQAISGEVLTGKSGVGNTGSRLWAPGHWPLVTTGHSCLIPASRALPHIPEALLCYNTECSGLSELIWCIGLWFRYIFLSFSSTYKLSIYIWRCFTQLVESPVFWPHVMSAPRLTWAWSLSPEISTLLSSLAPSQSPVSAPGSRELWSVQRACTVRAGPCNNQHYITRAQSWRLWTATSKINLCCDQIKT